MSARKPEKFRTLYLDPGETTGWAQSVGTELLGGGQEVMWHLADDVWSALKRPKDSSLTVNSPDYLRDGVDPALLELPIKRIVCEDFRIYPWEAQNLAWDPVRTARVIGAYTFMCRQKRIPFVLQGAKIKEIALAAGAAEFFLTPQHPNRHHNDAVMHYMFFTRTELMGIDLEIGEKYRPNDRAM